MKRRISDYHKKRILLFGGTTEGRLLAEYIAGLDCHMLVCVATEYGRDLLPPEAVVHIGRLDKEGMKQLIGKEAPELVIDATHPYAVEVTKNIQGACGACGGIRLLRCVREGKKLAEEAGESESVQEPEVIHVANTEEAVVWLSGREGRVLVTTGSKELKAYSRLEDYKNRLYVRVLPAALSLQACWDLGIDEEHIIAAQGPFSEEQNRSQLREHGCSFLVTKDGGAAGGFQEKLRAAKGEGVVAVVIERPDKEEGASVEEIKAMVRKWAEQKEG